MIHYTVKPLRPEAHLLEVRLDIPDPGPSPLTLHLPAWIRGSYMIRDFARHIVAIRAESQSEPLDLVKQDKQTWLLTPSAAGEIRIIYQVYAWDLTVRTAHVDTTHAYFNGPCVFLGVKGREAEPCEVTFERPDGTAYRSWKLALSMSPLVLDDAGFGRYRAPDYETLLDHPVEMGAFEERTFQVQGKPHRFVISGRHQGDMERLCGDLAKICEAEAALFEELPVSDYLFLLQVVGNGYGGLEHHNSSSLMISRDKLPAKSMRAPSTGYRQLLGLCSHEYFHLWHVKRITPAVFRQQGTAQEVYTRQLWIFEGITSYYDELILVRSQVIQSKDYLEMLAECVTRVMRNTGRLKQTLEESSFDAWTKFYKQDENAPNAIVNYYAKGALVAMLLDLNIRLRSDGRLSLDNVMRALWQSYGKPGNGLPEGAFEALVAEVTGLDFKSDFDHWLRSTEELPLAETLREFGVVLHLSQAKSPTDLGGVLEQRPGIERVKLVLGAKWMQRSGGIMLQQVFDGGAAQLAGLAAEDEIIAVDGLRLEVGGLDDYLARLPANTPVTVHAFRRDELMRFEVTPLPAPADTCYFYLPPDVDAEISRRQADWLQGRNSHQAGRMNG